MTLLIGFILLSSLKYVEYLEKKFLWCAYWVGLGILSSVGLGTGLHTFLLYLVREHFFMVWQKCTHQFLKWVNTETLANSIPMIISCWNKQDKVIPTCTHCNCTQNSEAIQNRHNKYLYISTYFKTTFRPITAFTYFCGKTGTAGQHTAHISTVKRLQNDNGCKEKLVTIIIWSAALCMAQCVLCVSTIRRLCFQM